MNKTLAGVLILGTGAALLVPPTAGYARHGDDDSTVSQDDRGRDDNRPDDSPSAGDDDGTPDQGRGDNGPDDSPSAGDDDGTPDQGRGDNGADDSPSAGEDNGGRNQGGGRDQDRGRDGRVDVRRSGQCSADSAWRLRIRVKDDRSRIKWQIKTGVAGESWSYTLTDNGSEVAAGTRVTHGRSGDFTVQRKQRGGAAGAHVVTATAENVTTGETCSGEATA